ncbi:MAG: prepilin-type N-terminal cleavage/methylation domain-containing protein [Desulfitobacteriaceae bacterium]|nr:prepilin-type N-terminal cleavage/methylation domain-containing protein [Desulfitobacteriaceae bacterium]MDD4346424.1 prepilin-type N-terminal cleavage/methylation domain-containing protein [Desulfitobacteriaceae bacterium]MDD4400832.1 prepilin-type N-terminal cleavage/methylation domain-containing protein [Desulfitobacteriaceae bacterium]
MSKLAKSEKGFTLIEIIVVIAILIILAAIAIPRFTNMRIEAAVKADASTAAQIANACRVQETQTGSLVDGLAAGEAVTNPLQVNYMEVPNATQTGGEFTFAEGAQGGSAPYVIQFEPSVDFAPYNVSQTVTERTAFIASIAEE